MELINLSLLLVLHEFWKLFQQHVDQGRLIETKTQIKMANPGVFKFITKDIDCKINMF